MCRAALGDPRAVRDLASVFDHQTAAGFVPHMGYHADPDVHADLWRVRGASCITQPPMYGHALRVLAAAGHDVAALAGPVRRGLTHLLATRRHRSGLLAVVHPWETGADDHPRWGRWQPKPFDRGAWWVTKGHLVAALRLEEGAAVASDAFSVAAAGFNALAAWNLLEAGAALGDDGLRQAGRTLAEAVDDQLWDPRRLTWADLDLHTGDRSSIRTLDALLPAMVTSDPARRRAAYDQLVDTGGFGRRCGPAGTHPDEATYDGAGYWRGAAWPQLTYLFWRQAQRHPELAGHAEVLADMLRRGADRSGLAEYWHPDTGAGLGARPHAWACLAVVCDAPTLDAG